jgi:hypothetical protein
LSSEVANQNIVTNNASMETTRKELFNHIKKSRAHAAANKALTNDVTKLSEDLADMTVAWKDEAMQHQLHRQITTSLTTDRDRYTVLY